MNRQHDNALVGPHVVKQRIKLAAALTIALVGVMLAWRSLGPVGSGVVVNTTPNVAPAPATPAPSFPLPTSLSIEVTAQNAGQIADKLTDRFKAQLDGAVGYRLRNSDAQPLLAEANALMRITLGGSFEQFAAHQISTGASNPILDNAATDSAGDFDYESYWKELAGVVARHPISIEDAVVRPRYIDGKEIDQPDMGYKTWIVVKGRYKIREDPVKGKLTIYEFIVPVLYEYEKVKGPAWWGVWLAKAPGSDQWVQVRSVMYDPAAIDAGVVPMF